MFTPIQLDKSRNFRYGMKALSLIEKKFKTNIAKIDMDNLTIEETATMIWAGLVHEDRDLTVEKVMDIIDEHSTIGKVLAEMGKAMSDAFGGDKDEKN